MFMEEGYCLMKKLLMLGGANAQVPAIRRAKELGYYVITCDYLPQNPGHAFSDKYVNISTVNKENVLAFAEKEEIDGIIAYASDPSAMTAAYVSDILQLPGASFPSVQMLCEKDLFRMFQKEKGFIVPEFVSVNEESELYKLIPKLIFPCMVKPVDSSGSKGVSKVESEEQVFEAVRTALGFSRCGRVIIEQYIDTPYYQLHGDGVVIDGKLSFVALGDQRFHNSVPIGSSLPSTIDTELQEKVYREVSAQIEKSGFRCGGVNIEVRVAQTGEVYVIEIGPRTGGNYVPQLMELATGEDEMTAVLQMAMGDQTSIRKAHTIQSCFQYIVGSDESGYFQKLFIDDYMKPKVVKQYLHKKKGDWIEEYENSNGVVAVILLKFQNMNEMELDIKNIKKHIRVVVGRKLK